MRVIFVLGLFLACGCQEGLESDSQLQGIVDGETHRGDPAVVLLELGGGLCTGTLISPRVVLTAAHCLNGEVSSIRAMFVNAMGESGAVIKAIHAETKAGSDLGAIVLASDGPVTPMPANPFPLEDHLGEPVKIVGFGVTSESGSDSGQKRLGRAHLNALEGNGIGAGELTTTNDPQGTCYGDSGGPNFMTIDGMEVVAGVTSRGTDVCGAGLDVAVRVDAHIDWIRSFIGANDPGECGADGECGVGCGTMDMDCCVSDGVCVEECGSADPECGELAETGAVGANAVGACNSTGKSGTDLLLLGLAIAIGAWRRRRRELPRANE